MAHWLESGLCTRVCTYSGYGPLVGVSPLHCYEHECVPTSGMTHCLESALWTLVCTCPRYSPLVGVSPLHHYEHECVPTPGMAHWLDSALCTAMNMSVYLLRVWPTGWTQPSALLWTWVCTYFGYDQLVGLSPLHHYEHECVPTPGMVHWLESALWIQVCTYPEYGPLLESALWTWVCTYSGYGPLAGVSSLHCDGHYCVPILNMAHWLGQPSEYECVPNPGMAHWLESALCTAMDMSVYLPRVWPTGWSRPSVLLWTWVCTYPRYGPLVGVSPLNTSVNLPRVWSTGWSQPLNTSVYLPRVWPTGWSQSSEPLWTWVCTYPWYGPCLASALWTWVCTYLGYGPLVGVSPLHRYEHKCVPTLGMAYWLESALCTTMNMSVYLPPGMAHWLESGLWTWVCTYPRYGPLVGVSPLHRYELQDSLPVLHHVLPVTVLRPPAIKKQP